MKNKILPVIVLCVLISISGFSQDTTHHLVPKKATAKKSTQPALKKETSYIYPYKVYKAPAKKPIYRDTRLGSSTKKYDTYKKNDKGAGAVTTSPK
jgi:hypothetical protein